MALRHPRVLVPLSQQLLLDTIVSSAEGLCVGLGSCPEVLRGQRRKARQTARALSTELSSHLPSHSSNSGAWVRLSDGVQGDLTADQEEMRRRKT